MSSQAPDPYEVTPLTPDQTAKILSALERDKDAILDELGEYKQEVLPTGRVLILPATELPHVAYMSDEGPNARLVLDDYVPEIGDQSLNKERPSDDQ